MLELLQENAGTVAGQSDMKQLVCKMTAEIERQIQPEDEAGPLMS